MRGKSIKSVLVIKLRHIGDVLITGPVFRALKDAFPGVRTTALIPAGTESMLDANPSVDEVMVFDRKAGLSGEAAIARRLLAGHFDVAINMTEGDRGAILVALSGARIRIGVDPRGRGFIGKRLIYTDLIQPLYNGRHRAAMDLDALAPLGILVGEPRLELFTRPEDDEYVRRLLMEKGVDAAAKVAVVHPTSRWLFKCWREEAVAEVVDHMDGAGFRVVITSGPDEKERAMVRRILAKTCTRPVDLSGALTLPHLAALIKAAGLFFGVDSAPMHMAAALGTPVVALFGPSDYRVWGPLSDKAVVVMKNEQFPCVPCRKDGCDSSKKSACLDAISVEDVIAAINRMAG